MDIKKYGSYILWKEETLKHNYKLAFKSNVTIALDGTEVAGKYS